MTRQRHRGKNPEDERFFTPNKMPTLKKAVEDLSYLYTRNYSEKAAIKIVGDHYQLKDRQRIAVQLATCSDLSLYNRHKSEAGNKSLKGYTFLIDGYNLLITIESLLSGGILICGRDKCIRDIASLHGSYHKVEETIPALKWIGENLSAYEPSHVQWFLDKPISNSKRLAQLLKDLSNEYGWTWDAEVVDNPDAIIVSQEGIVISSDSWILDRTNIWLNFVYRCIKSRMNDFWILDFSESSTN
ncbi:MAG TPA: DUF434 domain-containing protein [Candidatus Hydrogenedens sp.]|nr:DUF434 domain-containing protein [Candidatus Hydrogenedens sp.]